MVNPTLKSVKQKNMENLKDNIISEAVKFQNDLALYIDFNNPEIKAL